MFKQRLARVLLGTLIVLTPFVTAAAPAHAAQYKYIGTAGVEDRCGVSYRYRACLYWGGSIHNAFWPASQSWGNLYDHTFWPNTGPGSGTQVLDGAGAIACRVWTCTSYSDFDYRGDEDYLAYLEVGRLHFTYFNNASLKIIEFPA